MNHSLQEVRREGQEGDTVSEIMDNFFENDPNDEIDMDDLLDNDGDYYDKFDLEHHAFQQYIRELETVNKLAKLVQGGTQQAIPGLDQMKLWTPQKISNPNVIQRAYQYLDQNARQIEGVFRNFEASQTLEQYAADIVNAVDILDTRKLIRDVPPASQFIQTQSLSQIAPYDSKIDVDNYQTEKIQDIVVGLQKLLSTPQKNYFDYNSSITQRLASIGPDARTLDYHGNIDPMFKTLDQTKEWRSTPRQQEAELVGSMVYMFADAFKREELSKRFFAKSIVVPDLRGSVGFVSDALDFAKQYTIESILQDQSSNTPSVTLARSEVIKLGKRKQLYVPPADVITTDGRVLMTQLKDIARMEKIIKPFKDASQQPYYKYIMGDTDQQLQTVPQDLSVMVDTKAISERYRNLPIIQFKQLKLLRQNIEDNVRSSILAASLVETDIMQMESRAPRRSILRDFSNYQDDAVSIGGRRVVNPRRGGSVRFTDAQSNAGLEQNEETKEQDLRNINNDIEIQEEDKEEFKVPQSRQSRFRELGPAQRPSQKGRAATGPRKTIMEDETSSTIFAPISTTSVDSDLVPTQTGVYITNLGQARAHTNINDDDEVYAIGQSQTLQVRSKGFEKKTQAARDVIKDSSRENINRQTNMMAQRTQVNPVINEYQKQKKRMIDEDFGAGQKGNRSLQEVMSFPKHTSERLAGDAIMSTLLNDQSYRFKSQPEQLIQLNETTLNLQQTIQESLVARARITATGDRDRLARDDSRMAALLENLEGRLEAAGQDDGAGGQMQPYGFRIGETYDLMISARDSKNRVLQEQSRKTAVMTMMKDLQSSQVKIGAAQNSKGQLVQGIISSLVMDPDYQRDASMINELGETEGQEQLAVLKIIVDDRMTKQKGLEKEYQQVVTLKAELQNSERSSIYADRQIGVELMKARKALAVSMGGELEARYPTEVFTRHSQPEKKVALLGMLDMRIRDLDSRNKTIEQIKKDVVIIRQQEAQVDMVVNDMRKAYEVQAMIFSSQTNGLQLDFKLPDNLKEVLKSQQGMQEFQEHIRQQDQRFELAKTNHQTLDKMLKQHITTSHQTDAFLAEVNTQIEMFKGIGDDIKRGIEEEVKMEGVEYQDLNDPLSKIKYMQERVFQLRDVIQNKMNEQESSLKEIQQQNNTYQTSQIAAKTNDLKVRWQGNFNELENVHEDFQKLGWIDDKTKTLYSNIYQYKDGIPSNLVQAKEHFDAYAKEISMKSMESQNKFSKIQDTSKELEKTSLRFHIAKQEAQLSSAQQAFNTMTAVKEIYGDVEEFGPIINKLEEGFDMALTSMQTEDLYNSIKYLDIVKQESQKLAAKYESNKNTILTQLASIQTATSKFDIQQMMQQSQSMAQQFTLFVKQVEYFKLGDSIDLAIFRTLGDPAEVQKVLTENVELVQESIMVVSDQVTQSLSAIKQKFQAVEQLVKTVGDEKLGKFAESVRHQNVVLSTRIKEVYKQIERNNLEIPGGLQIMHSINPDFNLTIADVQETTKVCEDLELIITRREEEMERVKQQIDDIPVKRLQKLPNELQQNRAQALLHLDRMKDVVTRMGFQEEITMVNSLGKMVEDNYMNPNIASTLMYGAKQLQAMADSRLTAIEALVSQASTIDSSSFRRVEEGFRDLKKTVDKHLAVIEQIHIRANIALPQIYDRLKTVQPFSQDYVSAVSAAAQKVIEDIERGQTSVNEVTKLAQFIDPTKFKELSNRLKSTSDDLKFNASKLGEMIQAKGIQVPAWITSIQNTDPFSNPSVYQSQLKSFEDQYDTLVRSVDDGVNETKRANEMMKELKGLVMTTQDKLRLRKQDIELARLDVNTVLTDIRQQYKKNMPVIDFNTAEGIQRGVTAVDRIRTQITTDSNQIEHSLKKLQNVSSELDNRMNARQSTMLVVDKLKRKTISDLVSIKAITEIQALQEPSTQEVIDYVGQTRDKDEELDILNADLMTQVTDLNGKIVRLKRQTDQNEILTKEAADKIQEVGLLTVLLKTQNNVLKHQKQLYTDARKHFNERGNIHPHDVDKGDPALLFYYSKSNDITQLMKAYNDKVQASPYVYEPEQSAVLHTNFKDMKERLTKLSQNSYVLLNSKYPMPKLQQIGQNICVGINNATTAYLSKINELLILSPTARLGQEGQTKIDDFIKKGIVEVKKSSDLIDLYTEQSDKFQSINLQFWGISHASNPRSGDDFQKRYASIHTALGYDVDELNKITTLQIRKIERIKSSNDRISYDDIEQFQQMLTNEITPRISKIEKMITYGNEDTVLRPYMRQIEESALATSNAVSKQILNRDQHLSLDSVLQAQGVGRQFAAAYNKLYFSLGQDFVRFVGDIQGVAQEGKADLIEALTSWQKMDPIHGRVDGLLQDFDRRSLDLANETVDRIGHHFKTELVDMITARCAPRIGSILERMDEEQFSEVLKSALKGDQSIMNKQLFGGAVLGEKAQRFQKLKAEFVEKTLDDVDTFGRYRNDYHKIFHSRLQESKRLSTEAIFPIDTNDIKQRISTAQSQRILLPSDKMLGTNLKERKGHSSIYDIPVVAASFLQTQKYIKEATPEQLGVAKQNMAEFRAKAREFQQNSIGIDNYQDMEEYQNIRTEVFKSITQDQVLKDRDHLKYDLDVPVQLRAFQKNLLAQIHNAALIYDGKSRMAMDMGLPYGQDKLFMSLGFLDLVRETYDHVGKYLAQERNSPRHQDFGHDLAQYGGNRENKIRWVNDMARQTEQFDAPNVEILMQRKIEEYKTYNKEFNGAQQEQINQIDNLIVQMEERNNQYGSVNQLKQQLGADFEKGVMDTIRRSGLGNYQEPQVKEQMLRHLSRASGAFRDTQIPQSNYDNRRQNPGFAARVPQHNKEIMGDQREQGEKKQAGAVLTDSQLQHLKELNLLTPAQIKILMNVIVRGGVAYKKQGEQLVKLNDKEKLEVAMILIDLCLVIMVVHLKQVSKDKAAQMREKMKQQATKESGVDQIASRVKDLVNQL